MPKRIFKDHLAIEGDHELFLPLGSRIIEFGMQYLSPTLWFEFDVIEDERGAAIRDDLVRRVFRVFETEEVVPEHYRYQGSCLGQSTEFHVYENMEPEPTEEPEGVD